MPRKFSTTKKEVLVAFYQFIRESDGKIWLKAEDVEPYTDGTLSRSFIQIALTNMETEGFLEGEVDYEGDFEKFRLTARGITQAEKYAEDLGLWSGFDKLRTSVSEVIDLQDADLGLAKQSLDDLIAALQDGNDVGFLSEDEVTSAINEVGSLRAALDHSKLRVGPLAIQGRQTLKWIGEQAAKTVVGELAKKALGLLLSALGYGN